MFRLEVEVVQFRRVRCSSGAELSPHHRNNRLLGQFNPYIWGWVDTIPLYIQGRRNFSEPLIRRVRVRIAAGAHVTPDSVEAIGADGYGEGVIDAVTVAKELQVASALKGVITCSHN